MNMKQYFLMATAALLLTMTTSAHKYFTKTGRITFDATTSSSPEKIEGVNKTATCVLDTKSGAMQFAVLMKGFLYTVTETKPYPEKVVLLNSAIKLSTINEETVVHLKKLEEAGTKIYSCGTCLNYYDLADQLKVGVTGNMYDVVDSLMSTSDRIIL